MSAPTAADVQRRLDEFRRRRGYLMPHQGVMAAALPALQDGYGVLYKALTLDLQHLSPLEKEFVWLAVLATQGSAPALTDLVSGQVQLTFGDPVATLPHVRSGALRALGVSGDRRLAIAPEVPTVAEAGLPGYVVNGWFGVVAPAGTPPGIVERLNGAINTALADAAVQERLRGLAVEPAPGSAADFQRVVASENRKWSTLVRQAGISAD